MRTFLRVAALVLLAMGAGFVAWEIADYRGSRELANACTYFVCDLFLVAVTFMALAETRVR